MIVLGAVTGGLVAFALCPLIIRELGRRAVLDTPVARSSHAVPTLRGGGVAPALGAAVGTLVAVGAGSVPALLLGVMAGALAFAVVGLADDLVTLSSKLRLLAQMALAAGMATVLAPRFGYGALLVLVTGVSAVWLVAYVNAFNFMDGINGISVTQAVVAGIAWAAVGAAQDETVLVAGGLVVATSAAAFLPFNFPVAKVFLGDVGSYFFGAWLGAMALVGLERGLTIEMALAPLGVYLADTGATLVRRAHRGAPLMEAHRDHAYQRLADGGWSHARVVALVATVMVLASGLGAVTIGAALGPRLAAGGGLAALLTGYLLAPRLQRPRPDPSFDPAPERPS